MLLEWEMVTLATLMLASVQASIQVTMATTSSMTTAEGIITDTEEEVAAEAPMEVMVVDTITDITMQTQAGPARVLTSLEVETANPN